MEQDAQLLRYVLQFDVIVQLQKKYTLASTLVTRDVFLCTIVAFLLGTLGGQLLRRSIELAAVGISIAVFNQVSRIAIFPLVSVTTSFVAEEDAMTNARNKDEVNEEEKYNVSNSEMEELIVSVEVLVAETSVTNSRSSMELDVNCAHKRKHIPSVSTALLLGGALGLLETLLLILSAKPILGYMGVMQDSAMLKPALQYLVLRSLGAPAVLLSLAMQGVFRGLKDTKTPLYATESFVVDILQVMAILASAFARKDYPKAATTVSRILQVRDCTRTMDFPTQLRVT
ncbi:hypothetical protein PR202_gb00051 [Eleusine coracana subsp. coracana]|uniref:Protein DETOXIFICATION n=1 Tax=Eleusine coracana subsp. coracana TaxID=191504 RepID=A0AAV5DSJ2_ELECO|nr:hypothetical protein PR202_gb00051 [Eleusine coracana subsp. coracana]